MGGFTTIQLKDISQENIDAVSGSWSTFIERGCTRLERKIFDEHGLD